MIHKIHIVFIYSWTEACWEILELELESEWNRMSRIRTQKLESSQGRGLNVTSLSSSAMTSYRQRGLQRHAAQCFCPGTRKPQRLLTCPDAPEAWRGRAGRGAYTWVLTRSQWRTWATSSSQIWCLCQTGRANWSSWTFWTRTLCWCKQ